MYVYCIYISTYQYKEKSVLKLYRNLSIVQCLIRSLFDINDYYIKYDLFILLTKSK